MYRFLNSGAYIGEAGALAAMLGELDYAAPVTSDQTLLNKWFLENPDRVALDYDQELFASSACQAGLEKLLYRWDGTHLVHRGTGGKPWIFHFPAENSISSGKILDMLPFDVLRLPTGKRGRRAYARNVVESRLTYLLDRPSYPLEDVVTALMFRVAPALLIVGATLWWWLA
jgi:hypothetical protein